MNSKPVPEFCICGSMPGLSLLLVSYLKMESTVFLFPFQLPYGLVLIAKSLEDEHMILKDPRGNKI